MIIRLLNTTNDNDNNDNGNTTSNYITSSNNDHIRHEHGPA